MTVTNHPDSEKGKRAESSLFLNAQIDEAEEWLKKDEARQKKRKPHEDPLLLSAEVNARIEALRKPFNRLKSRKKPKPPPAPKPGNATSTNSTEEVDDLAGAGKGGGEQEVEVEAPEGGPFDNAGIDDEPGNEGGRPISTLFTLSSLYLVLEQSSCDQSVHPI